MKKSFIFSLLILPSFAYAFFCPNNFSQVNFGDNIEAVRGTCKPDKEETKDIQPTTPQEWNYYIPQTVAMSANEQTTGTMKTSFAFDKDGKAINLTVNGIGVGSTDICGTTINLGDSIETVKAACGEPAFINQQQPPAETAAKKEKMITFIYNNTDPAVKLIFVGNILVKKE